MAATTPTGASYALADHIHDGQFAKRLREWRDERPQPSFDDIARRLEASGVFVSRETVRRWCRDLGLTGRRAA